MNTNICISHDLSVFNRTHNWFVMMMTSWKKEKKETPYGAHQKERELHGFLERNKRKPWLVKPLTMVPEVGSMKNILKWNYFQQFILIVIGQELQCATGALLATTRFQPSFTFSKWSIITKQPYKYGHTFWIAMCIHTCRVITIWYSTLKM